MRYQTYYADDADYLIVAFGSVARICLKAIEEAREAGIKKSRSSRSLGRE